MVTANFISGNLPANFDEEGNRKLMLDEIIDDQILNNDFSKPEGNCATHNSLQRNKHTTKGWEMCVLWKYRSNYCTALKYLKEYYPVEFDECMVTNVIQDKPEFIWWVNHVLKKCVCTL